MKKAFTLLEMLIVLGIIAVIMSALTVSYSSAQKKTRDSRRKSDLKAIQSTLEQYYSRCGFIYPMGSGTLDPPVSCAALPGVDFLPTVPVDPKANATYKYTSDGSSFTLCTSSIESEAITGFCVANQQ